MNPKVTMMNKTLTLSALTLALSAQTMAQVAATETRQARIIGGTAAAVAEYPWMVSIKTKDSASHFCGASLIDKQWVLTAAHCVQEETAAGIQVTISEYDQQKTESTEQTLMVSDIYIHQQFGDHNDNDIALLKLAGESDKTPVALADTNVMANLAAGTELTTIGWGLTKDGDDNSLATVLQQVNVPLYDQAQCKTNYATVDVQVTGNMVCAGFEAGGKDSCQGDSGGPLFIVQGGSAVQLGITSFGEACAKPSFPGVYARVASYQNWIAQVKNGEIPAHTGPVDGGMDDIDEAQQTLGLPGYLDIFVEDNAQSGAETITLKNSADAAQSLMVNSVTITGEGFSLTTDACQNQTLAADASCELTVNYQVQDDEPFGEGLLTLKTNHAQHSDITVELLAINSRVFDDADDVSCDFFNELNIRSEHLQECDDRDESDSEDENTNDANENDGDDESDDDDNAFAGDLTPWSLLGLLLLPVISRRR